MKKLCNNCDYMSDKGHELDPLGQTGRCFLHKKDVHEDTETCPSWIERVLTWPPEKVEDDPRLDR